MLRGKEKGDLGQTTVVRWNELLLKFTRGKASSNIAVQGVGFAY